MWILGRIDRVLVTALVLLAVLASACGGSADEVLDALIENAEEPAGEEPAGNEPPRRLQLISGPRTVPVDASVRFTVVPDPGGARVDWRIDHATGSPYSRPEDAGSVLTYEFLDAGQFVVSARLWGEDGPLADPVSIVVEAVEINQLQIDGPSSIRATSTARFVAKIARPKPDGSRVQWGVEPDGDVLRELDETSEADVAFDQPGTYTVSAWLVGSDGSRLSNEATYTVSVKDEFTARLGCSAEGVGEAVFLDDYFADDRDAALCLWQVEGGIPALEAELAIDGFVIAVSTFAGIGPEAGWKPDDSRLIKLPALPPGRHVVTLRVTDSTGKELLRKTTMEWRWKDPSLAVQIVAPDTDVEVVPRQTVSFEVDFRDNVDISSSGQYTVTWQFDDGISSSDDIASTKGSSFAGHAFDKVGTYTVTATVQDREFEREGSAKRVVTVKEPPLDVTLFALDPVTETEFQFIAQTTGGVGPYEFRWGQFDGGSRIMQTAGPCTHGPNKGLDGCVQGRIRVDFRTAGPHTVTVTVVATGAESSDQVTVDVPGGWGLLKTGWDYLRGGMCHSRPVVYAKRTHYDVYVVGTLDDLEAEAEKNRKKTSAETALARSDYWNGWIGPCEARTKFSPVVIEMVVVDGTMDQAFAELQKIKDTTEGSTGDYRWWTVPLEGHGVELELSAKEAWERS